MKEVGWAFWLLVLLVGPVPESPEPGHLPWTLEPASPLEAELLEDVANGQLERFSLLEAALIASGVDNTASLDAFSHQFWQISRQRFESRSPTADRSHEARALLDWLHENLLTGDYHPACTEIHRTLQTGAFNCVTSTILFRCLADSHGLTIQVLGQPDHVYCRLSGSPPVIIQTTSPHGVMDPTPPDRLPVSNNSAKTLPVAERLLSDVQLVGKIYYNRGVLLLEQGSYAAALPHLVRAVQLDTEDLVARGNLIACLNNWAIYQAHSGSFPDALALLAQGKLIEPDYVPFSHNEVYVYYRWAKHLAANQQFAQALQVLNEAHARHPSISLFESSPTSISEIGLDSHEEISPAPSD
jgi:tetratricopeptide (TPR) repeat protein